MESKLKRAEDLNRRYKVTGTPTVVVNGKYVTDVRWRAAKQPFQVINDLAAKEKPPG